MPLSIFNKLESEVRGYIRSFPVIFDKAKGSIMTTDDGTEYIDFFAGAGTLNYGHNNPQFKQKILDYIESDSIIHGLDMATLAKKTFLQTFEKYILKPRNYTYKLQFTGPTGTNAVEAALKLARQVTGRSNIIAFTHAFHGVSAGSLAVTGNDKFRSAAGYLLPNVTFLPYDGYFDKSIDTIALLDKLIADPSSGIDKPAAVIVETVQGEGGINVASTKWLQKLADVCKNHDILLIVDDIQIGCGRSGEFFSFEEAGIEPDIITLSKSLSGYGLPMSMVMIKPKYDIWTPGAHSGTFRGNNLAFVGATAAIETYWKDDSFSKEVHRKEQILNSRLQSIDREFPEAEFCVRGRGLMQGLASTKMPDLAEKISKEAFKNGVIIETSGAHNEVLKFLPALTIEDELLKRGLDIIENSVKTLLDKK